MFEKPPLRQILEHDGAASTATARRVFLGVDSADDVPAFSRVDLGAGFEAEGPLIIDEYSATTIVPPGVHVRVDEYANLWLEAEAGAR
jgi:N-methylhydantoinase A